MPLKLGIVCGDRSGPFYHDFHVPTKFFIQYGLIDPLCIDYIDFHALANVDVVQFQRQYAPESLISLRKLKEMGKVVIAHVDDDVWDIPPNNPARPTYTGAVLDRFNHVVAEAHAVTTSTPPLKAKCEQFNKNVHIFRNLVDPMIGEYQSPGRDKPDRVRVGWTGTPHHHDDIIIIESIFPELTRMYPKITWVFMGYRPPTILSRIPRDRWEYYDFVQSDAYYPCFANLDLDIGIAPLADVSFNKCKTARKAQEYAILGVPMVLSPISTYKEWVHGETCLKPKNNKHIEWVKDVGFLVSKEDERKKMGKRAYEQVMRNHNIHVHIHERAKTYYDVYEQVKGKPYGPEPTE